MGWNLAASFYIQSDVRIACVASETAIIHVSYIDWGSKRYGLGQVAVYGGFKGRRMGWRSPRCFGWP